MRTLSVLDLLIIGAVLALLVFAASRDFGRYDRRTLAASPAATTQPGH